MSIKNKIYKNENIVIAEQQYDVDFASKNNLLLNLELLGLRCRLAHQE